jgi:hypothetical protein
MNLENILEQQEKRRKCEGWSDNNDAENDRFMQSRRLRMFPVNGFHCDSRALSTQTIP